MQRLSNDQLAEKMRAANRRRSERQRAKRVEAGRAALTVWIPANLQKQIVELATAESATTSEIATRLLQTALEPATLVVDARSEPEPANPVAEPADTGEFNQDLAAFKSAVVDYWNSGMRVYGQIATALKNAGYRNSNGNLYTRDSVKKSLIKSGLVAETETAKKEHGE